MKKNFNIFRLDRLNINLASIIMTLVISSPASATSLLPINLQQLSTRASLIFYGEVISNQTKKDPQSGHIATFTKFKIIELIKGDQGEGGPDKGDIGPGDSGLTHTIKQLGGYDDASNTRLHIHGVPEFKTGNQYIVFLPKASSLGFCSPLGLQQGSFSVYASEGETIVSNGFNQSPESPASLNVKNYRSIQVPLAVRASNPAQSRLDDFINTVRAHNTP